MARPGGSSCAGSRSLGATGADRGLTGRCGGPLRSRWRGWQPGPRALSAAPAFEAAAAVVRVLVPRPGGSGCAGSRSLGATGADRGLTGRCGGPLRSRWRDLQRECRALSAAPASKAAAVVVRVLVARPGGSSCAGSRSLGATGADRGLTGQCSGPLRSRWRGWQPAPLVLSPAPAFDAAAAVVRVLVTRPGLSGWAGVRHSMFRRGLRSQRAVRRVAEEPVAGLAAGMSSSERGAGL